MREKIWRYYVKTILPKTDVIQEARKKEGESERDRVLADGNFYGARSCALLVGYKEKHLFDVYQTVRAIMNEYVEGGGDPYNLGVFLPEVYKKLAERGLTY